MEGWLFNADPCLHLIVEAFQDVVGLLTQTHAAASWFGHFNVGTGTSVAATFIHTTDLSHTAVRIH